MFVTKKKFDQLIRSIVNPIVNRIIEDINENQATVSGYLKEVDDQRKNGDDALSKIIKRHRLEALNTEGQTEGLCERLREAETRIDNLIETINDERERHNVNVSLINDNSDTFSARFSKCEARIMELEKQTAPNGAIYFHYAEGLEVGLTYWLKVCSYFEGRATLKYDRYLTLAEIQKNSDVGCKPSHEMVIGKWDGMKFVLPDGAHLSHESVVEVGEIIETPEL